MVMESGIVFGRPHLDTIMPFCAVEAQEQGDVRLKKLSTRQLINTKAVSDYSLKTYDGGDLVYFMVRPTNLSCCPIPAWGPGYTP